MNHMDMERKRCKNGTKTPQIYIVHHILMPVVSEFMYCLSFKCIQYQPKPQTCAWTVIGDQNPTYEQYGYRAQMVQKRVKNTSKLHCSSHACARSIIFYFLPSIQVLTIPSSAPNMCVDGDR